MPSYQLDRGRFENELARRNLALGTDVFDGCEIDEVELHDDGEHLISYSRDGEHGRLAARWVIDASGYTCMLKKKLGLAKDVEHTINSAWFRLAGGLDIDGWVDDDPDWLGRMASRGVRRLSTNHLMGEGYWVWLIPLASGPHSIGVVADPRFHSVDQIVTLDTTIDWLKRHERQLGEEIDRRRDQVEDFHKVENFAYSATRVFSPDRWAITGVAGVFADPFYSPGSDFIAQSNTFITELVDRDLAGEDINKLAAAFNAAFLTTFETLLRSVYTNRYRVFGNAQVMSAKIIWEFAVYWANAALPFFYEKLTDLDFAREVRADSRRMAQLSSPIEQLFGDWHDLGQREWRSAFVANDAFPALYQMHLDLHGGLSEDELRAAYRRNAAVLEAIAVVIFHKALSELPDQEIGPDVKINPVAISLHPDRWQKAGLFNGKGLTLNEAREATAGLEKMLVDELVGAA